MLFRTDCFLKKITFFMFLFFAMPWSKGFGIELEFDFSSPDQKNGAIPSIAFKVADEVFELNSRGIKALDDDKYAEALECFNSALDKLPGYTDAINNIGVVHFRTGNIAGARSNWLSVVKIDASYSTAWYNLGIISMHEKDSDAALRYFENSLKNNRRFFNAYVMTGKILLEAGKTGLALKELKKAFEIIPAEKSVWTMYAFALVKAGNVQQAMDILNKHPDDPDALEMAGRIEASAGNIVKAREFFQKSSEKGGKPDVLFEIAFLESEKKSCNDVLKTLSLYFSRAKAPLADAYILAGAASKDCGNITNSIGFFESGLKAFPGDPIIRFNLGQMYFLRKDYDLAKSIWAGLSDTMNDPLLFHLQAIMAKEKKDLESAEQLIRKAISIDPGTAQYYDFLGLVLHQKGMKKESVVWFKKALETDPSLESARIHLAVTAKTDDDLKKAIERKKQELLSCAGECEDVSLALAILYYHSGYPAEAASVLKNIPNDRMNETLLRHLAIFYKASQNWTGAIDALATAAKNYVVAIETQYLLAECYMQAGRYPQAANLLARLASKWPENSWKLYYQAGYASLEQNKLDEARVYLQKSMNLNKNYAPAQGLLAFVYNRQGNSEAARNLWQKTIASDPSNSALWINMGLALEAEGKYSEALENYRKAAALTQNDNSVWINIGNVHSSLNNFQEALIAYEKAVASTKKESAVYNVLITSLKLNDLNKARAMLATLENEFSASQNTLRAKAELLLRDGDTLSALNTLTRISEPNENDWYLIARIHLMRNLPAEAEKALNNIPDDSNWKKVKTNLRAEAAFSLGKYTDACNLWKAGGDTAFSVRYNISLALLRSGKFKEAFAYSVELAGSASSNNVSDVQRVAAGAAASIKDWKQAEFWYGKLLKIKPGDPSSLCGMAIASYNLGKINEAIKLYDRAINTDSGVRDYAFERLINGSSGESSSLQIDSLDRLYNEAVTMQTQGMDTAAEKIYRQITLCNPDYFRAWNNLGAVYSGRADLKTAVDCYQKAVENEHSFAEAYANLVAVYIAMEDYKQAKKWLMKGTLHNPDNPVFEDVRKQLEIADKQTGSK
jgi:tetratricopeptide (TPR) repeat protein